MALLMAAITIKKCELPSGFWALLLVGQMAIIGLFDDAISLSRRKTNRLQAGPRFHLHRKAVSDYPKGDSIAPLFGRFTVF